MFRFIADVVVDGTPYHSGDIVPAESIPVGSLDSLLRMRQAERYVPPVEPVSQVVDTEEKKTVESPKPASKKAPK